MASSPSPPPPSSSDLFLLLALLEQCPSPSAPALRSSSSSSSSSVDSAFASSSLLSSPLSSDPPLLHPPLHHPLPPPSPSSSSFVHVAHQLISPIDWQPRGPIQHLRLHVDNVVDELEKLAISLSDRYPRRQLTLVCSRKAIRQSIYPLVANAVMAKMMTERESKAKRTEEGGEAEGGQERQGVQQLFSARLPLPPLFRSFVPFPPPSENILSLVPNRDEERRSAAGGEAEGEEEGREEVEMEVEGRMLEQRLGQMGRELREKRESAGAMLVRTERIGQGYTPALCSDLHVDSRCVVRARGLPWHVSDLDVAMFFSGLDIPPGGIALCLGPEGRRSGEALVRFERADQRELALQRHRRNLHARYIEVYKAAGEEFVRHAVGTDCQAVRFALRAESVMAMIVRMRGLPFSASDQQIRDFFAADGHPSGILDPGGILFVHRPDGRPSGDAFVLFGDEASGRRGLAKHRQRMGGRYIELFRTTQAEVQQLFNARTIAQQNAAALASVSKVGAGPPTTHQQAPLPSPAILHPAPLPPNGHLPPVSSVPGPHALPPPSPSQRRRDCLRLRGLPYEAQVQQVVEFLGPHARHVLFQGVHMIYNSAGHPSGEAFIQMESEQAAAQSAHEMHNKYMELGKKRRYIEVFQCCAEDMSLLLNVLPPPPSACNGLLPPSLVTSAAAAGAPPLFPLSAFCPPAGAPASSPLLAFPSPPFLPFPDPMGGAVLLAGQFAAGSLTPLPLFSSADSAPQLGPVPSADLWLRHLPAVALRAPAPFVQLHHGLLGHQHNGTPAAATAGGQTAEQTIQLG